MGSDNGQEVISLEELTGRLITELLCVSERVVFVGSATYVKK
jgi:hypothetical protein